MHLNQVEEALEGVKNAINEQDLANRFKEFGKEMVKLNYVAARRQQVPFKLSQIVKKQTKKLKKYSHLIMLTLIFI